MAFSMARLAWWSRRSSARSAGESSGVAETVVGEVPQLFLDGHESLDDRFVTAAHGRSGQIGAGISCSPSRCSSTRLTQPLPPFAQGSWSSSAVPLSLLSFAAPLAVLPALFGAVLPAVLGAVLGLALLGWSSSLGQSSSSARFGLPSDLQGLAFLGGSLWSGSSRRRRTVSVAIGLVAVGLARCQRCRCPGLCVVGLGVVGLVVVGLVSVTVGRSPWRRRWNRHRCQPPSCRSAGSLGVGDHASLGRGGLAVLRVLGAGRLAALLLRLFLLLALALLAVLVVLGVLAGALAVGLVVVPALGRSRCRQWRCPIRCCRCRARPVLSAEPEPVLPDEPPEPVLPDGQLSRCHPAEPPEPVLRRSPSRCCLRSRSPRRRRSPSRPSSAASAARARPATAGRRAAGLAAARLAAARRRAAGLAAARLAAAGLAALVGPTAGGGRATRAAVGIALAGITAAGRSPSAYPFGPA